MAVKLTSIIIIGLLANFCSADVNTLRQNQRYVTRLNQQQRFERIQVTPTPYPAAGFRPDRTFTLPTDSNNNNNNNVNINNNEESVNNQNFEGGNAVLATPIERQPNDQEVIQRPQLTYGAPASSLRQPQIQPQTENLQLQAQAQAQLQQQQLQQQQYQQQQYQKQLQYVQQLRQAQLLQAQHFQQAQKAQQAQQSEQLKQTQQLQQAQQNQFQLLGQYSYPRLIYGAPASEPAPAPVPVPAQSEKLTSMKSSRLTSNREDREDIDDSTINNESNDIEADIQVMQKGSKANSPAQVPQTTATVAYFPANAINVVQPFAAFVQPSVGKIYSNAPAYVTAPLSAAPLVQQPIASPYFQQPYTFPAAPAQLQAW